MKYEVQRHTGKTLIIIHIEKINTILFFTADGEKKKEENKVNL